MSDTPGPKDTPAGELAREGIERAEGMDESGSPLIEEARKKDPAATVAAEQEAEDGPTGRGLSR